MFPGIGDPCLTIFVRLRRALMSRLKEAIMKGWYQVGFADEVTNELTPTYIGNKPLMLVRDGGQIRAFDALCPHRGAHLAYGGRLRNNAVVCPYHGHRIQLGDKGDEQFSLREYASASIGGMVFVRLSPAQDNGWLRFMNDLERDHVIINGFTMAVRAPMSTVIENAFDQRHFTAVHGIRTDTFTVRTSEDGALIVESTFYIRVAGTGKRGGSFAPAPYRAVVVSPGLVAVELRGPTSYTVITGATDLPAGGCVIRLSLAFPKGGVEAAQSAIMYETLLQHSRRGLEEDQIIWENLSTSVQPRWTPEDQPSLAFFAFCESHCDL